MQIVVVTPPGPLLTWADLKPHLRADSDDDQALVETYIAAATSWLDAPSGWLGPALGAQTLKATLPCFGDLGDGYSGGPYATLPFAPVTGALSVTYFDSVDAQQTLDPSTYWLVDSERLVLRACQRWPQTYRRPDAVAITYAAGFAEVPAAIKQAIMLIVGHWYWNREAVGQTAVAELPFAVEALLSPFRRYR